MTFFRATLVAFVAFLVCQYVAFYASRRKITPVVAGFFHPSFRKVAETLKSNIENGRERGASFAVVYKGEVLMDMWAGAADVEAGRAWQEDTLALSFSVTKGAAAIVLAKLFDMGVLDYKKEVRYYWPEFGSEDKKNVTVEMLLSHQAGLIGLEKPLTMFQYRDDWKTVEKAAATMSPKWPAGSAAGYHSWTFGMYADVLVRKVDPNHRNLSQFFQEEIAKPLGLDYFIGLPPTLYHRFARTHQYTILEEWRNWFTFFKLVTNPLFYACYDFDPAGQMEIMNNPDILAIGMPSLSGVGTARSLAKLYDILANGGRLNGKPFLSPAAMAALKTPLTAGLENKFFAHNPFTVGLMSKIKPDGQQILGHPGFGGNIAFADMGQGFGLAYLTNHLSLYFKDDPRFVSLEKAFYECFDAYLTKKKGN